MKEKIQDRINRVRQLAAGKRSKNKTVESRRTNDSLSKSIRNSKEADIFLTELNTTITVARLKKD